MQTDMKIKEINQSESIIAKSVKHKKTEEFGRNVSGIKLQMGITVYRLKHFIRLSQFDSLSYFSSL